ncbi:ABC transporter substrate-binding protein [Phenylobacterium sp.]|uniref:ABC transporter substrate-binding protein n=1 Tax=Phenylobacterium sp. TaxID=1871053 RepID=UPI002F409EA6
MRPRFRAAWLARHVTLGLLIAGAVFPAWTEARAQTVLRARLNADIVSTNPGVRRDENTDGVLLHVTEGLVAYREDLSVGPLLAQGWEVSKDGRSYTFHLRHEVKFHNGAPLTSAEVVWSFHRYLDPKTHWRCLHEFDGGGFATITGVQALDLATVRITLDKAAPQFLSTLSRLDCGGTGILYPSSVGPDGSWRAPIGTGPFRFAGWKRNQYIDLVRFPAYQSLPGSRDGETGGKAPLVDRVRFLVIPDPVAAEAALLRGELDVVSGLLPIEVRELRRRKDLHLEVQPTMDLYGIFFQTKDPVLRDVRLRQAIAATVDVAALTRVITQGTAAPDRSVVPDASRFHDAIHAQLPKHNIVEARRLAAAAGYHGQPIKLLANHRYPLMFDAAVLVQAMAREAGINIVIDTVDWASQLARYNSGKYQMMSSAYSARLDPSLSYDAMLGNKSADPRKLWDDPEAVRLLARSRATADPAERQKVFDQLHALFLRDVPAIALFNSAVITAVRGNVTGLNGWPAGQPRLWGVGLR